MHLSNITTEIRSLNVSKNISTIDVLNRNVIALIFKQTIINDVFVLITSNRELEEQTSFMPIVIK